ncbi:hypothetical protein Tco_0471366 [Tanacetum coccineum]
MIQRQDGINARSEYRPPMLYNGGYISWSRRIIRYIGNKPNGKLLIDSFTNGTYVLKEFNEPFDPTKNPPVAPSTQMQTTKDLTRDDHVQSLADKKAIIIIPFGFPDEVYNTVDANQSAYAIWEKVKRLMEGLDNGKRDNETNILWEFDKFMLALKYGDISELH